MDKLRQVTSPRVDMGIVNMAKPFDWGSAALTVAIDDDPGEDPMMYIAIRE